MMTPPLSIWASPRLAVQVPVSGECPLLVGADGAIGSTVMAWRSSIRGVRPRYPYISKCHVRVYGFGSQSLLSDAARPPCPITRDWQYWATINVDDPRRAGR